MHLAHLSLTNFRNYARLELPLPPGVTVVTGDNAQGKSNLLEAIYFLATTKSFRASSDRELISWLANADENPFARLVARLERRSTPQRLEIVLKEEARGEASATGRPAATTTKRILINGAPKRVLDLFGQANVVMFSPQDIELVAGAPLWRRRYLDITISQVDSHYVRRLAHYNRVMTQRNHLLRQIRERQSSTEQLRFWDEELAATGAYLLVQRQAMVAAINRLVRATHRRLTESKERLHLVYRGTVANGVTDGEAEDREEAAPLRDDNRLTAAAERFRELLHRNQAREISYGVSLFGPHRDDLSFLVDDREMGVYGSRGQQRTVALSLKLAEAAFIHERTAEHPIVLLDDVMSELDHRRGHQVLEALDELRQVIITAIDLAHLDGNLLARANLLRVETGAVARCPGWRSSVEAQTREISEVQ